MEYHAQRFLLARYMIEPMNPDKEDMTNPDTTTFPKVHLGKDGIMRVNYGHNPVLSTEGLLSVVERRLAITRTPTPVLVSMTGRPVVTPNQTSVMHEERYRSITTAVAYVTTEWYIQHLINIHLKVNKPPFPLFIFDTEEEAVPWLARFIYHEIP
ncbi:DUF7793 family protein [Leeia oryzae]|uniref:DUF7793 family protein n=1 Tax=Leeia oryzae TaxID=356662 RepID=UPI00036F36CF|nr:hypothetical protein [Leeia oryzae]